MPKSIVNELLTMDSALVLLKQQYADAAFRDDFAKADEFDAAHRLLDERRQALWMHASDAELADYEIRRHERQEDPCAR